MYYSIIPVCGHYEVFDRQGRFLFSADTRSEALSELGRRGMHRVWVEPGPELALAMLENGLADRFFLLRSPEKAGSGLSAGPVLDWLRNAEIAKLGHLGRDSLTEFRL